MHVLKSLKPTGKAAIILPHGVLFRGNSEADIRKKIIDHGYIKGIIGLPANLFYGTGIPACIIIIDKEGAAGRKGIFIIDASREYVKDGNKNRLREQDIHKIVATFQSMDESDPKYARFVPNREIKDVNEYNLNISRYIDSSEPEEIQDISAHLNGGIPAADIDRMEPYWKVFPSLKAVLFRPLKGKYYIPQVKKADIVKVITLHEEFLQHAKLVEDAYWNWKNEVKPILMDLTDAKPPKVLIEHISQKLLNYFSGVPLLDKYEVYQVLMDYWAETMQDDVYVVCYDGYVAGRAISYDYVTKKKKENGQTVVVRTGKVKGYEGKLIPKGLLEAHYFGLEVKAMDLLRGKCGGITKRLSELVEENSGENGVFFELDSLKRQTAATRIKLIKNDPSAKGELDILKEYVGLLDQEANVKIELRRSEKALDEKLQEKYPLLPIDEIKQLLVEEKWFASIYDGINRIHSAVSHRLSRRLAELMERYEFTLQECQDEVAGYEAKVKSHLERMGFLW